MANKKFGNKKLCYITGTLIILCTIMIAIVLTSKSASTSKKLETLLNLGNSYMDELDYEAAIAAYEEAIRIEPKSEEAYIALANAYIEQGEYEKAIEVLDEGYAQTEATAISDKRDEVALLLEQTEEAEHQTDSAVQATPAPTPTPIQTTGWTEREDFSDGSYDIHEMDANGYQVKSTSYNADGTVIWWSIAEHDDNGFVKMTTYNADGTVKCVSDYYENGKWVKRTTWYNADGTVDIWLVSERDENGKCIKETIYNADGTVRLWIVPEYDANGKRIKDAYYSADGTFLETLEY